MDDQNRTADHVLTNTMHLDLPNGTLSKVPVEEKTKDLSCDESTVNFSYSPSELEPSLFEGINLDDFVDVVTTYKCKFCNFSCAWKSGLMSHLRTTHIEGLCRNQGDEDDINREPNSRETPPLPRPTTNEMVTTTVQPIQEQQVFLCGQCNRGFTSLESCKEHMLKDHKTRKKRKTTKRKQIDSEAERKRQEEEKRQATDCIETLSKRKVRPPKSLSEDYYLPKTRIYTKKQELKDDLFKCDVRSCNQQFSYEKTLTYHTKCHMSASDPPSKNSLLFQCPECSSRMNNWRSMTNHLWTVHQVDMELRPCPDCSYRTSSTYKLETHRLIHKDERSFVCTKCDKTFKQLKQLQNHQVVHTDRKNLKESCWYAEKKCEECNRTFSDSKCLRKHMESVHNKLRPYVCTFCGHTSARKSMLQLHVRQHTGEKPFRCNVCEYATRDHNSLRRHKMRHTGLKKYKCPHCTYACIQSSSFKNHIKNKHPGMDGFYCCEICSFRSVNKENFHTHLADHKRDGNVSKVVTTSDSERSQPQQQSNPELDTNTMDVIPENLAAAQLIFSCLNAFTEKGGHHCSFEAIDDAKSQTITIHIPNNEEQRDGDQIYLTIQQPDVINPLNESELIASIAQTSFERIVRNEEVTQNTNEMSNSEVTLGTSSGDHMLDFCTANMPLLVTDTS